MSSVNKIITRKYENVILSYFSTLPLPPSMMSPSLRN